MQWRRFLLTAAALLLAVIRLAGVTNPAHTLNIIQYRMMGQTRAKHTFWGWSSISRPDLSNNPLNLAWTGRNYHLYFANSTDGVHWTMPSSSPLAHQSAWAPSMFEFSAVTPDHWLAWTGSGTTSTRNLNVQYTQHYPNWSDPGSTATFGETAISSPELAAYGYQVLLAWTGTDSAHRLNVAVVSVTS